MRAYPIAAFTALMLSACTVGPDYAGPPELSGAAAPPAQFARGGEVVRAQAPQLAQWWTVLGDPVLNDLETRALADNPGIAAAQARVRQARSSVLLERAGRLPQLSGTALYAHAELPGIDLGSEEGDEAPDNTSLDFLNLGLNASWELEFAGGHRRLVEAAGAQAAAAQASVADAQVQLTAEVAQAYVNLRERQNRLAILERQQAMQRQMLDLARQRQQAGTAPQALVEQALVALERTTVDIAGATAERDAFLDALAVLTGRVPGTLDAELGQARAIPLPPESVAVGDPAALIARRPDVRVAERTLAAASARVGVARAAQYPRVNFMGILGLGGTSPADLVDLDNVAAIALPQLQWNFLDFGRNKARIGQAGAALEEAEAQYRQNVLAALQDAEGSLSRFGRQRQAVGALARAEASARRMATLAAQRYDAGIVNLAERLEAERQADLAKQNLDSATAALTGNFIAVQKSLGLGWQAGAGAAGDTAGGA